DLNDIGQQQQRAPALDFVREVVERDHEALALELGAALDDFGRNVDRLQHFEHDLFRRQQFRQVRQQQCRVAVDETLVGAKRLLYADFAKGVGDDAGRCRQVAFYIGGILFVVAEQQFIGKQFLSAIEYGLSANEEIVTMQTHSS